MCIDLRIARRKCRTLVDSGACRSLISKDMYEDIQESKGNSLRLQPLPKGMILKSLSQNVIKCPKFKRFQPDLS